MTPELQQLLSGLLDGQLSDAARLRFAQLLRDDPSAQDWYARYIALHALLHLDFGDGNFQLLPPIVRQVSDIALISKEVNNAADASVVVSHEGTQPAVGVDQRKFQADKRRRTVWITLAASILLLVAGFMLLRHTPGSPWHSATASQKANLDQQKEIAEAKFSKNETHSVAVLGQASRVSWTDRHLPTEIRRLVRTW